MSYRSLNKNVGALANAVAADINNFGTELAKVIGVVNALVAQGEAQRQGIRRAVIAQLVIDALLATALAYYMVRG